ncbi:putative transporter YfdV [Marinomonas spartinae]|uniref:AEC family transporter n=1 Tax=Marinomonas spartinae TaxID=1792290 RepID=UPI000808E5ED|nr:AEC family transporter [Marinomonas spartinae]SBS30283.1 putative transporter YfdV [Marinomonas spartinae]
MDAVLNITAPIFFLILLGYLVVRFELLPAMSLPGLSRFVLYLALPALVFTKLLNMDLAKSINISYMAVYAGSGLITLTTTVFVCRWFFKDNWVASGVRGLGATMPNSAFIGFPVLLQFFHHPPTQAFAMSIMVENIILMPLGLIFVEAMYGKNSAGGDRVVFPIFKRVISNPIILSVCAGLIGSSIGFSLPVFLSRGLDMLALASAPVALIVIGGSLVGVSIKGSLKQITLVATGKLIFFPLVVMMLLSLTPNLPSELKAAVIVFSAVPMFSIYPIIGDKYGERSFCASTLLITTVASFFTLSIILRYFV